MEGLSGELKTQVYDWIREEKGESETQIRPVLHEAVLLMWEYSELFLSNDGNDWEFLLWPIL